MNIAALVSDAVKNAPGTPVTVTSSVLNDAAAQLQAQIVDALRQPTDRIKMGLERGKPKIVGLIAPGTGLGGAFFRIEKGRYHGIGDGHVHDMMVKLPEPMMARLNHLKHLPKEKRVFIQKDGNKVMAGDILSGTGFGKLVGPKPYQFSREFYIEMAAQVLEQVVRNLKTGNIEKQFPDQNWSQQDADAVKPVSAFFYTGGMGRSDIGKEILARAEHRLRITGVEVSFLARDENQATYGAALAALEQLRGKFKARE